MRHKRNASRGRKNGNREGAGEGSKVFRSPTWVLPRRDFLKFSAFSLPAGLAACAEPDAESMGDVSQYEHINGDLPIDFSLNAIRRDDFVALRFDFINFAPGRKLGQLERQRRSDPAFVIVNFQSQHVFEQTFPEPLGDVTLPDPGVPVGARLGGESRVAFQVPPGTDCIPRSLSGLLGLVGKLQLHVALNATPPGERQVIVPVCLGGPVDTHHHNNGRGPWCATSFLRGQRRAYAERYWSRCHHHDDACPTPAPDPEVLTPGEPPINGPANHETALELPFRLILSPNRFGAWAHASSPVRSKSGRVELWHTRLGVRADGVASDDCKNGIDESDPTLRKVRAIWTRDPSFADFDPAAPAPDGADDVFSPPFKFETLRGYDRDRIVHLTSNFAEYPEANQPVPIDVNRLMLSAMGGWLDVRGEWTDVNNGTGLEQWEQRGTLGRDHYVKVVDRGFLYPFGHRASVVQLSERKFKAGEHEHIAYLRKRTFIIVREPEKRYDDGRDVIASEYGKDLRTLPFVAIRVVSLISPDLDSADSTAAFVPKVGSKPFRFRLEALDVEGNLVSFDAPVMWLPDIGPPVDGHRVASAAVLADAVKAYDSNLPPNGLPPEGRVCALNGQRVAFAPSQRPDDTVYEVKNITFKGRPDKGDGLPATYPGFFPVVESADIALEVVRQVAGVADAVRSFKYHDTYRNNGFGGTDNAGDVLLKLASTIALDADFNRNSNRSGGFLSPSFSVVSLSRLIGPVSGTPTDASSDAEAAKGNFDPAAFFGSPDLTPKLFGIINLTDILDAVGLDQAPKYITEVVTATIGLITDLETVLRGLQSISFPSSNFTAIQKLLDDVALATGDDTTQISDAIDRIADDVDAAVADLRALPAKITSSTLGTSGLRTSLAERAQALIAPITTIADQLVNELRNLALAAELPKQIRTRFTWRARVKEWEGIFVPKTDSNRDTLLLEGEIIARTDGSADPQVKITCTLEDFKINLIGDGDGRFLTLNFERLRFVIDGAKKPDVQVTMGDIEFAGPLKFIETLKSLIPLNGFEDPPNLAVTPGGITAGFTLPLPNVAVGILSLENINLSAALDIPFIGRALTFSFNFSTRENPFNLTVALLGGGGFFGLKLNPQGIEVLEASLEAGARISLNFGVASGSISAMIGIYFRMETPIGGDERVLLTGYFRLRGEVDVLGLITASIQLSLELTYQAAPVNKLKGRATLEIEVEVLFFSTSVTITCERTFAGSNGDPTFYEVMAPRGNSRPWDDYLAAFAA